MTAPWVSSIAVATPRSPSQRCKLAATSSRRRNQTHGDELRLIQHVDSQPGAFPVVSRAPDWGRLTQRDRRIGSHVCIGRGATARRAGKWNNIGDIVCDL